MTNLYPFRKFLPFLVLWLLAFHAGAESQNALLDSASKAYAGKNYTAAATYYEKILSNGSEAPQIYFNLGNSYYKSGNIPKAILNYERARRLKPGDDDIDFNLKTANQQIVDKTETTKLQLVDDWKRQFFSLFTEKIWGQWSILGFLLFLVALVVYISSSKVFLRQLSFFVAMLFLAGCITTFFITRSIYVQSVTHDEAIIMAPNITAKGSPDEKGTDLFILHEGTKVSLLQSSGNWREIKLANGPTGWLPQSAFEKI